VSAFVVDASVAIKWVLPENDSESAEELVTSGAALHAPAFIFIELANVLWKRLRSGKLDEGQGLDLLSRLRRAPLILRQGEESLPVALSLAGMLDHPVYDCAYLALALHIDAVYVTADERFRRKAGRRPELVGRVRLLEELAERD
jgi:predicted nucleic acid-binding protein